MRSLEVKVDIDVTWGNLEIVLGPHSIVLLCSSIDGCAFVTVFVTVFITVFVSVFVTVIVSVRVVSCRLIGVSCHSRVMRVGVSSTNSMEVSSDYIILKLEGIKKTDVHFLEVDKEIGFNAEDVGIKVSAHANILVSLSSCA